MNRTILAAALLAAAAPVFADQLLTTGSFEYPRVQGRVPKHEGGNPLYDRRRAEWLLFAAKKDAVGGRVVIGLNGALARTGRQSMFVEFEHLTASQEGMILGGDLIPILPGKPYRVSIWGRIDRKNPLTIDQRVPYLKLFVDWVQADRDTNSELASTEMRVQPIPGGKKTPPLFTEKKWNEYFAQLESPADAGFMRITWRVETPPDAGETHGIIYFDDATIEGEPGPEPPEPTDEPEEEMEEKEAADPGAKPADKPAEKSAPVEKPAAK